MPADKDYVITKDGLVFNVIGYEHPPDRTTASLKYVNGEKGTAGYFSAVGFLKRKYPEYLQDGFISIPDNAVEKRLEPREGLLRLRALKDQNEKQKLAVELIDRLSDYFGLPLEKWGIADSLLWGPGKPYSDIDVVVYGQDAVTTVQQRLRELFNHPGFKRFELFVYKKPPAIASGDFKSICERKLNFGYFHGTKFSLRAAREENEINRVKRSYESLGLHECTARVTDSSGSLFFPITYKIDTDIAEELVCFSNSYENVFYPGDELFVSGTLEKVSEGDNHWKRLVIGTLKNSEKEYVKFLSNK